MSRFDWDGVNLAELYFESLEGAANPARFTPMNDDVRAAFRRPSAVSIPSSSGRRARMRRLCGKFLDYRAGLARRMQEEWLHEAEDYRDVEAGSRSRSHPCRRPLRYRHARRDRRRYRQVLPLLKAHDFTFLIEDPATVWNLGPQRYPEIAKRLPGVITSWRSISTLLSDIRMYTRPNSRRASNYSNSSTSPPHRSRAWLCTSRIRCFGRTCLYLPQRQAARPRL